MKLRNKLLTVLPLASISVLTPIAVSSCSCSDSYVIKFTDAINCKDKDNKTVKYHSINDVKNASKNHIQQFDDQSIEEGKLKSWDNNKEFFYWDLVYSLANANVAFMLTWGDTSKLNDTEFSSLKYKFDGDKVAIFTNADTKLVESYCYALVKKA